LNGDDGRHRCRLKGSQLHSARQRPTFEVHMGMIGFDIACETARSGPRMQGYLVNDPRKQQVPISSAPTLLLLRKQ